MTLEDLNSHLDLVNQLHRARDSLQSLEDRILGAQQYDGMPHGAEMSRKVENLSLLLDAHTEAVERLERMVSRSEESIRIWVEAIPDIRTRSIFNLRFICGLKWEEIPEYIGANSVEAVKNTVYRYLNLFSDSQ